MWTFYLIETPLLVCEVSSFRHHSSQHHPLPPVISPARITFILVLILVIFCSPPQCIWPQVWPHHCMGALTQQLIFGHFKILVPWLCDDHSLCDLPVLQDIRLWQQLSPYLSIRIHVKCDVPLHQIPGCVNWRLKIRLHHHFQNIAKKSMAEIFLIIIIFQFLQFLR